ncbi:MAG TPA: TraB/GumN family protein [Vicinamibacterales bacterium]|nr:TraB/GumN family protein [Vicinamibacterales bacterium]
MRPWLGSLRLIWATVLVAAYATTAVSAAPALEARQDVTRRGLLYEIRTGANTVYLFGTLHIGKPELYPLGRQINLALAASQRLYLEVNLTDATTVNADTAAAAMYGDGITLDQRLPPALMEKVSARLARYQFPQEVALKMKPWMLGQTLLLLEAKRRGYDPELANEFYLMDYARAAQKEILGLETLSDQFAIFDRMSPAQQQAFLEQTLSELEDSRFEARLKAMVDAWANADARALEDELQHEKKQDSVFGSILLPRLIDERNRLMADRIADIARSGPKSFVAVGALHLVGKDGIVELLRRRGFTVRQL